MNAQDKLQVVLLGTSGSGKSASGNTILGKKVFKSHVSTQSVTLSHQTATARIMETEISIVDTPGWHCTKISEDEVIAELNRAILSLHGPYSFLMVIPIGSYTPKEMQMISKLHLILGNEFLNHTTILFSHYDNLESKSFEQFLKEENGQLKTIIQDCENRVYTWNNKDSSSVPNIASLLQDLRRTQKINEQPQDKMHETKDLMTFNDGGNSDVQMKKCKKDHPELLDKPTEQIRVVVLGMAGVGKTSTIKTLTGKNNNHDNSNTLYMTSRPGKDFKFIDSPGFKSVEQVSGIFSQSLSYAAPGPHVLMIVIKVGRMTKETYEMINRIHDLLDNSVEHTIIVFSHKDDLENKSIKQFIEESPELTNLVEMYNRRFYSVNNKDINDHGEVCELLEGISFLHQENNGKCIKDQVKKAKSQQKKKKSTKPEHSEKNQGTHWF